MQSQTQHSQPFTDENASSKNMKNDFGLLLWKQTHLFTSHQEGAHSTLPCPQSQGSCEVILEQHFQKHFQACQREKDPLGLSTEPPLTEVLRGGEAEAKVLGRVHSQETIVWRKYGGAVTCSVLNHFQGTERLAAFPLCWLVGVNPTIDTGTWVTGREGKPGFWTSSSLWALLTHLQWPGWGVRSVRPCWLPLAGHAGTLGLFCTYNVQQHRRPSQWALAASAGGAACLYFMVRKAQNFYQPS